MPEWMPKNPYPECSHDKSPLVAFNEGCEQTARAILAWLYQSCPHSEPLTLTTRHECDKCMEQLCKEVDVDLWEQACASSQS
jgi:hypothetical protein